MSNPKKGDLSASEKELFEVISAGETLRLKLKLNGDRRRQLAPVTIRKLVRIKTWTDEVKPNNWNSI